MDELASNSSSSSGNSNGNNNNVNTNNNAFLETSKAERAMWLMKCPPLVSRALQSPPFSSSSPPDSSSSEPPRPVAKVVLSIDPLRSNDDNSSTQVFTFFYISACLSYILWFSRVLCFVFVPALGFRFETCAFFFFSFFPFLWVLGFCVCLSDWACVLFFIYYILIVLVWIVWIGALCVLNISFIVWILWVVSIFPAFYFFLVFYIQL